jgi:hypothetical protein
MRGTTTPAASRRLARAALGMLLAGGFSMGAAVAASPARATVGRANGQIAFAVFNPAVDDDASLRWLRGTHSKLGSSQARATDGSGG